MSTIRDLIQSINEEIDLVRFGQAVPADQMELTRRLINRAVNAYNLSCLIKFNASTVELVADTEGRYLISGDPVHLLSLHRKDSEDCFVRLTPVDIEDILSLRHSGSVPEAYSYKRGTAVNGALYGQVTLDVKLSSHKLMATVAEELPEYQLNDNFVMPPEYRELIIDDVQLRLLRNADAEEKTINDKSEELKRIVGMIKDANMRCPAVVTTTGNSHSDFLSGRGML